MIKDVIKQSNILYKENFQKLISHLILWVFLYSLIYQLWDHYTNTVENTGLISELIANIILVILESIMTLAAINIFLNKDPFSAINSKTVFIYFFTYAYISIASILGLILFIIPGLFVISSSMVFQIFIINNGNNPMQAIENSIELLRGKLVKITLIVFTVYIPISIFILALTWISIETGPFYNIISFVFEMIIQVTTSFYLAALSVAIYHYCLQHHQPPRANF